MRFLIVENLLWASSWLLWCVLTGVLYVKKQHCSAPVFFSWSCVLCLEAPVLFVIGQVATATTYDAGYWLFAVLEISLQLAVAIEFAKKALKHRDLWVCNCRTAFIVIIACVSSLALILTALSTPAAVNSEDAVYARLSLFSSLEDFFLCVALLSFANRYGVLWNSGAPKRFGGFMVWSSVSAVIDTVHVCSRTVDQFEHLDMFRMICSQAVVVYWIATSWQSSVDVHSQPVIQREALEFWEALTEKTCADRKSGT